MKIKNNNKYTIGLFIDSLLDDYQKKIWQGIFNTSKEYNINLITYIGGSLKSTYHYYKERNSVYDLVNKNRISGLIVFSGSLSSYITKKQLLEFLKKYSSFPLINIGYDLKEYPSIITDNESSMRKLVEHFVVYHKYKKIAFICGMPHNNEANCRLNIYKKVLKENNIKINKKLILPGDFLPLSGKKAVSVLLDKRKTPFDAIIASNDYMALSAIRELQSRGIKVPEEVAVGGFDNISRSIYSKPQLTTVNQSPYRLGRDAVVNLHALLSGKKIDNRIENQGKLLIRQSCGCLGANKIDTNNFDLKINNIIMNNEGEFLEFFKPLLIKILNNYFQNIFDKKNILLWTKNILEAFFNSYNLKKPLIFLKTFEDILRKIENQFIEIYMWNDVLYELFFELKNTKIFNSNFIDTLLSQSIDIIKDNVIKSNKEKEANNNMLDWELLNMSYQSIYQIDELEKAVSKEFKKIGIQSAYFSLFKKDSKNANLLAIYDNKKIPKNITYTSSELLPKKYYKKLKKDYIVMSLFYKENLFGFIVYELGPTEGKIYEILTLQLCGIIQNIKMFEKISSYTKSLEFTVKERTKKLEKANVKIEENNKELKKLDKLKNDFIANITHDFRSPLTAILNIADLSLKLIDNTDDFFDNFQIIYNSSLKLKHSIDRLLNLTKIDSKGIKINLKKINITSFLEMILLFYKSAVLGTGIKIIKIFSQTNIFIYTDIEKLEQVINNIISNAIKFINNETGEIIIDFKETNKTIIISISDNGIGIQKNKINKIFNRFEQADEDIHNKYGGTGIGLAFSKQLIDLLKGKIWAESDGLKKGAAFFIELPKDTELIKNSIITANNDISIEKFEKSNKQEIRSLICNELNQKKDVDVLNIHFEDLNEEGEYNFLKSKILIIDDILNIREIIKEYLSNYGYKNFITASDGKKGLEAVYKYYPDIIICDYNMPNMKGDEFHDELLANPNFKHIPFIFLSAVDNNKIILERREKGASAYLKKPIEEKELLITIEYHIKNYFKYKKILRLATIDELVELNNYRSIIEHLLHELSIRKFRNLSIIFFDIDNFKDYNDCYGHLFGNNILRTIGKILNNNKRKYDIVGRYGGDEFIVILPDTDINQSLILAEKLKKRISDFQFYHNKTKINISVSMGISSLKNNSSAICSKLQISNLEEIFNVTNHKNFNRDKINNIKKSISKLLIQFADEALYKAKQTKCNKCGYVSNKSYKFINDKCPECKSTDLIKGKNKIILFK